jgi:hypothetical protein
MFTPMLMLAILAPYLVAAAYFLGQFANFWNHATSIINAKNVPEVTDLHTYLSKYAPRLLVRFLAATIAVIIVALIPKIFFPNYSLDVHISNLSIGSATLLKCAAACGFGLLSDVVLKKVQDVLKSKGVDTGDAIPEAPSGKTQISDGAAAGK